MRLVKEQLNEEGFTKGGNPYKKLKIGRHRYPSLEEFWDWLKPESRYDPEDAYLIVYSYKDEMPSKFQAVVDKWYELYHEDLEFQKATSKFGDISIDEDDPDFEDDPDLLISTNSWTEDWNERNGF